MLQYVPSSRSSILPSKYAFSEKDREDFIHLYKACARAQTRLIDFFSDSCFVLQLLRCMVERELDGGNEKSFSFPFVRDLAEDVIVNKSINHKDAPSKIAESLQTADYFREFDAVLEKIMINWEISHE